MNFFGLFFTIVVLAVFASSGARFNGNCLVISGGFLAFYVEDNNEKTL